MSQQNRPMLLVGFMLLMLFVMAGWSTMRMLDQRDEALVRTTDLAIYLQLASDIEQLRDNEKVKQLGGDSAAREQLIAERVTQAGQKLGLQGNWWEDTIHRSPRRVGNTPYLHKPTVLYTSGLSLMQITSLLYELTYDSPLTAHKLTLRTPLGENPGDRWDANITLTYLLYEPARSESIRP